MEKWHLVARAGDFLLVVWCGENPALQYNGAFLLSRHRTAAGLQPAAEQQFREVLARHGLEWDAMCLSDNTDCPEQP